MGQTRVKQTPRTGVVVRAAQMACVLEASAEKPGNVTPSHDFDDLLRGISQRIALGPELAARASGRRRTVLAGAASRARRANTTSHWACCARARARCARG